MTAIDVLVGVAVFAAAAAYDAVFALYVRAAGTGQAVSAANCSVSTLLVGTIGVLALTKLSVWYVLPEAAGMWVGTWLVVHAGADRD